MLGLDHVNCYFGECEDFPADQGEVSSGSSQSKTCIFVVTPHRVDYVGCACVSSGEEEGELCKDASHVKTVVRQQDQGTVDVVVGVPVIHHGIDVLNEEVAEGTFSAGGGPGVVVESKNKQIEGCVDFLGHFTVVSHLIVKFSAAQGGGTVIDGGGNDCNREDASSEDALIFEEVALVSYDGTNTTRDSACGGAGV